MTDGPPGTADETSGAGAYAGLVAGIVLACGALLPGAYGLGWTTIAALVAGSLAASKLRARGTASWAAIMRARGPGARLALLFAVGFAATVLAAVAARIAAQLVIAFPGALPGAVIVLGIAVIRPRTLAAARWLLGPAIVVVAFLGARCESEGDDARGSMHSGAIHGIHPFQTTAVIVDGYGPHDLPFNDYVEPIGDRGYDPSELAAAIELALHRIAEVHYEDGPARARMAFAGATAGAVETAPVRERLDRDPPSGTQPRFWVRSGTTGQRSKVEFVCPGRRDDPRGPQPETVMNRMCPDKYANEASAGLSVTGRWPGYAELRGNERMGLSQIFGWTRSDDAKGVALVELERWLWVVIVLAIAVASAVLARRSNELSSSVLPLVLPLALLVLAAASATTDVSRIPLVVRAPTWSDPWQPSTFVAVLAWPAAAALACWLAPHAGGRARGSGGLLFLALALAWLAATDLGAAQ
ncbi:MAG TPA: hypothetical protein VG755_03175, partial [Nannocystaceae bacterium]|nr:hypothetical protein [Nannocystaceae bacterium]